MSRLLTSTEAARQVGGFQRLDWLRANRGLKGIEGPTGTVRYRTEDLCRAEHPSAVEPSARALSYVLVGTAAAVAGGAIWLVLR